MKSLYSHILAVTLSTMLLSGIISFLFSNIYYQVYLKSYNDEKVTAMANNIADFYLQNPKLNKDNYLSHVGELGYEIYLVDQDGQESYYGGSFSKKDIDTKVVSNVFKGKIYHGIRDFPSKTFITGFFDSSVINTIGVPLIADGISYAMFVRPDVGYQFGEMRIFFAVILSLSLVLSIILVMISTRYIVRPVYRLTEATKQVAQGNYKIDLKVNRRDEIGQLADHFSHMAKSIEQLEEMRQEFVSNVSHEIQSPLASIQGFSQTLQVKELPEETRKHYLSIIEEESRRLSQLSKQLLMLASLEKEETIMDKSTFDVAAQIKQVLFMTEWSWREKDLAIDLDIPKTMIYADEKLMYQVWVNLITNSIKFSDSGGSISIKIIKGEKECHIEIKDTGKGISEKDLPHIFNRFYKADKARSRKEGSSGLGLAITKKIIDLHNGSIYAESELSKGTAFHITIPKL
ncbi:sensor histidine kinase [Mesobacillus zeae]|uniref:Heme sensor protein HssS n=1 Tax=Mesobacillus zeae TaxID=1917180 RepID=A0A398BEQ2_9BACI|nr:HAMP domain-containing sensor histidine kinase [Mesobacillus zeae]RID88277.1 sensor histidine kinase [Mesobacillus zeae]